MPSQTMTIRLDEEVRTKLERLSRTANRAEDDLAAEAVAAYVDREFAMIEGIQLGLADIDAGRLVPHEQAMARLNGVIEAAEQRREKDAGDQMVRKRAR